ncbi:protein of unknown function [Azospirillum baldaniorum]|uniref:Uncharacterized protein n=1 Tax=Azospirillum baldaniorum TaxID=1064539 RepID=A0A9P1NLB8_9PROT|nr:protein of unknown function [Azospirillum baldaniorum]
MDTANRRVSQGSASSQGDTA